MAPASLYAAQAAAGSRAAGLASGAAGTLRIGEVRIERPLVLPAGDGVRRVQFVLEPRSPEREGAAGRRWQVFSRGSDDEPWVRHAAGRLEPAPQRDGAERADPGRLRAQLRPVPPEELSRRMASAGVVRRSVLSGLWSGSGEALGEASPSPEPERSDMGVSGMLDAAFETLGGMFGTSEEDGSSVWLPVGWDLLWLGGASPREVLCHARWLDGDGDPGDAGEPGERGGQSWRSTNRGASRWAAYRV